MVNQSASSVTVHVVFELIENVVLPASAEASRDIGVTVSVIIPLCSTKTCCGDVPSADIVIVAILTEGREFAVNVAVMVPFPLPPDGLIVNQSASSVTVHVVFELIVKDVLPASGSTFL
jgi:hypothetical protein